VPQHFFLSQKAISERKIPCLKKDNNVSTEKTENTPGEIGSRLLKKRKYTQATTLLKQSVEVQLRQNHLQLKTICCLPEKTPAIK
jgi:hypothetical protein